MAETKDSLERELLATKPSVKIKTIIFDLGGVLLNLIEPSLWQKAFADLGAKLEISMDGDTKAILDEYATGKYASDEDFLKALRALLQIPFEASNEQIIAAWNSQITGINSELYKLVTYSQKFQIFGLSNTNKLHCDFFENVLYPIYVKKQNNTHLPQIFQELFQKIYYSHEIFCKKPDPMAWKKILQDNHLIAEECLFVDDIEAYTNAANSLGIPTFLFDIKKHSLDDVIEYIDAKNNQTSSAVPSLRFASMIHSAPLSAPLDSHASSAAAPLSPY